MNKLFAKIASITAGLALVAGAGVALASHADAKGVKAATSLVATFECGADGAASHVDGNGASAYEETDGDYTLRISNGSSFYTGAKDAKGNGCFKLGTGKVVGSMSIAVPSNVDLVKIYVAGYKKNNAKVSINSGSNVTVSTYSDNGEYTALDVTTTSNKNIAFTTVTGGLRCMVNTIEFYAEEGGEECEHDWEAGTVHAPTCTEAGYTEYTCSICGDEKHDDEVAALGHDYGEWIIDTAATCTEEGSKHRVCSHDTTHVENEVIPATGHNFVNHVCTVCGAEEGSETTITLDLSSGGTYGISSTQGDQTLTGDGATYGFEFKKGTGSGSGAKANSGYVLFGKAGTYFRNTSAPSNSYISAISWTYSGGVSTNVQLSLSYGSEPLTAESSPITSFGKATQGGTVNLTQTDTSMSYFFIYVTNAYNCQLTSFSVTWTLATDPSLDDMTIQGSDTVPFEDFNDFGAYDGETLLTGVSWSVSDETVLAYTVNGDGTVSVEGLKDGSAKLIAQLEGYNNAEKTLTVDIGAYTSLILSGSMTKTEYTSAEAWDPTGFTVKAHSANGYEKDVTSEATWTYNPVAPAKGVTSVVATATYGGKSGSSSAQAVTVTKTNQIQALYNKDKGDASGEFYGYYVGFATGSGPIVMDGAWGMLLYNPSQDVSSWTEGETIVHVTAGTIDVYNGLYEVKSYTCETVGSADISTPITHTTTGNEKAQEANRLTNASGKVAAAPTKGSFNQEPKASDVQFTYTVGSKTFTVFYKKAAQESTVLAALADSLENGTEITIKGFTSWYNNFQVTMIGLVEADENYTAAEFAQDLLDQTDAVCTGWQEGDNNYDELVAVWSNLQGVDKYPALPDDQKEILAETVANEEGSVIEQALARYEFLCSKYGLGQFINGHDNLPTGRYVPTSTVEDSNVAIAVVAIVAVASISAIAVILIIKRRKAFDR